MNITKHADLLLVALLLGTIIALAGCPESNNGPSAHAGEDAVILANEPLVVDGNLSHDPDGDALTYSWALISSPVGAAATLTNSTNVAAGFSAATPGRYVLGLTVSDGEQTHTDEAIVHVHDMATACCLPGQFKIATADCPNAAPLDWKRLSDCRADDTGTRKIGAAETCQYLYVDSTDTGKDLGKVEISTGGRVVFLDDGEQLTSSLITMSGGTSDGLPPGQLVIGTDQCPIASHGVGLEFDGVTPTGADKLNNNAIIVGTQGELVMYGAKGVVATPPSDNNGTQSWAYLKAAAGPASFSQANGVHMPVPATNPTTTLTLSRIVDWQAHDWIVVAGTDFSSDHTEFVKIDSIDNTGATSVVTLNAQTPLKFYHFGSDAPSEGTIAPGQMVCNGVTIDGDTSLDNLPASFCDGPTQNFGVDERAEVGLVSRNVKLTSNAPASGANAHYGGQIKILQGYGVAELQGIEIEKFGQDVSEDMGGAPMSAYPIHFHMVGDASNATVVNSNSIHHTYNKCVTVHASNNITVENNVCARNIGHSYYLEAGTETGNTFDRNLSAGAMATQFTPFINASLFWQGDYLAASAGPDYNQYNGIDVATTSTGTGPTGKVERSNPSNFWISNPGNHYANNSAAGCQLQGRGYWILPETLAVSKTPLLNGFINNRAHGCYHGVDTAADLGSQGFNYAPQNNAGDDIVAVFTGVTATRNRNRGIWLRPNWYHVADARIATNRDGVSLVSAGGSEGVPPGEWSLMSDTVLLGTSRNNVERFGPCPTNTADGSCYGMGPTYRGNAIPGPNWNIAGFMFYDGPARLQNNRFVNFLVDITPELTNDDAAFLAGFNNGRAPGQKLPPYEGDAAMGWFQSNVNNYPPTQYTEANTWENVELRHQVYTEEVFLAQFVDGDKNTVILDRDGTLTGYKVVDSGGTAVAGKYPISLNNLVFNSSPYSVDECLSTGAQDAAIEKRGSSLISPGSFATLELTAWDPTFDFRTGLPVSLLAKKAPLTLIKDQRDHVGSNSALRPANDHYSMTLVGRNQTQVREPKVQNGLGYTVHSTEQCTEVGADAGQPIIAPPSGLPRYVSLGFTDATSGTAVDGGGDWVRPVRVRVGLCYKTENGPDLSAINPANFFSLEKGRKSYGSPLGLQDPNWKTVPGCNNLAFTDAASYDAAGGTDPTNIQSGCPGTLDAGTDPVATLTQAPTWDDFVGAANVDDYYYWDAAKGMLFFYMEQKRPNLEGGTPIGTCTLGDMDPLCEKADMFYPCPEEGCVLYTVRVVDQDAVGYAPTLLANDYGATACDDVYDAAGSTTSKPPTNYTQTYPPNDTVGWQMDRLAPLGGTKIEPGDITVVSDNEGSFVCTNTTTYDAATMACINRFTLGDTCMNNFPHATAKQAPGCPVNAP